MTALTEDRNTPRREGVEYSYPMAASVTAFTGGLAVLDDSGNCKPGVVATGLVAVGIFTEQKANGSTAAAVNVDVRAGTYRFENSADAGEITKAEIGDSAYIVDDATVTKDSTGASVAGTVVDVDALGVWVAVGI